MKRQISRLSLRHGGHVSHAQLIGLGLTRDAVRHLVRMAFLIPVYRGVYAVGHLPTNPIDRAHGALLACGPGAALSHAAAGALWSITERWPDVLELVVRGCRHPQGLTVHRSTRLRPIDFTIVQGLRATSRARTLLDLAPRMTEHQLLRAVNRQRADYHLRLAAVNDVLDRFPRHPGARRLREILGAAPAQPFRSEWEIGFPEYAETWDLPEFDMNVPLAPGVLADVVFRPRLLILELDGWGTHGLKPAFRQDRRRDRVVYAELGIPTFRLTYDDVLEHPAEEAALILEIIERRRRELGLARAA